MNRVYLDRIAAAPLEPEALEAMLPFLRESFGNPQSLHREGRQAAEAVDEARERVAALIGAESSEVYFTASGTEANNMAVKGLALAGAGKGRHIVVSAVEHVSVLNPARSLERQGFKVTVVPVDGTGMVNPADVEAAITPETALVSVIMASSEVGTVEPVAEIAAVCRGRGVLFHTDAVAAAGSIPIDVRRIGADALSLAAGQFYGPKGAAALFLRKGARLQPLVEGGNQESGRRGGTENVAAIVGMGKAAELALKNMAARNAALIPLRDRLLGELPRRVEHTVVTGSLEHRLPYHASFCVGFVEGESMLLSLDMKGVAASSGSACTSKSLKVSHVLLAMGLDHATAQGSLIFSLPNGADAEGVERVLEALPPAVERLRAMSPLYTEYLKGKGQSDVHR